MSKKYTNTSISALRDEQQVRKRPAVIFGTNDLKGCTHSIFEIIANAIDEAREGYGDTIEIDVKADGTVRVRDYGRGVPMDWNEKEKEYNWKLVFCTLYASGKYDDSSYTTSMGLNGLGATATQYASEFMKVTSYRDGKKYVMNFEKGKPVGQLQVYENTEGQTGTEIIFKPDKEVFTEIIVPIEVYVDLLRRQAMLHKNLKFILRYEGRNEIVLCYPEGITGFIESMCEKPLLPKSIHFKGEMEGQDFEDGPIYKTEMEIALNFSRSMSYIEMYHNGIYLPDGGSSMEALEAAITRVIDEVAKQSGKLKASDRILYKDIEEILIAVGSTTSPGHLTFFKNQTKTAINNPFIKKAFYEFVYQNLSRWFAENKDLGEKIIAEVLANKEARENAEAVKRNVIRKLSSSIDKYGGRPEKFVECASKNPEERELYIVEGDSAKGSCKLARDSRFQAIMPIRGKIMNCLKEDLTKILNSEVIIDLIRVIGCGIEAKSKYIKDLPQFDLSKLNWGKIIICTDADLDGMQIRCLILAMIYRLMPTLLKAGKVFIVETPLYEIEVKGKGEGKGRSYFAYSDQEKDKILNELKMQGIKESQILVQRSKGLGENDPEMMAISTMNPSTRRLIPVEYPENDEEVRNLFEALLGNDLEARRYLIEQYFDMEVDID